MCNPVTFGPGVPQPSIRIRQRLQTAGGLTLLQSIPALLMTFSGEKGGWTQVREGAVSCYFEYVWRLLQPISVCSSSLGAGPEGAGDCSSEVGNQQDA